MSKQIKSLAVLAALLRPVARFCIGRGLRLRDLEETLRKTMVQEAQAAIQSAIQSASAEVSVSKISVVTGIHRVEVARLLAGEERPKSKHDVLNRVIGLWTQSRDYCSGEAGTPRPLTHQGLSSEFAELVAKVSKEVSHYPIIFELERIGAVEFEGERIKLKVVEYTPQGDVEHGLDILSDDITGLTKTVEGNLVGFSERPHLHLRTSYDNINPSDLDQIRKWILGRGAGFHKEIRDYLSQFDRDVNPEIPKGPEKATVFVSTFSHGAIQEPIKQVTPKKRGRKKIISSESSEQKSISSDRGGENK